MTLEEKITDEYIWNASPYLDSKELNQSINKMIEITEDFAMNFADWVNENAYKYPTTTTTKELLKIYKFHKGL